MSSLENVGSKKEACCKRKGAHFFKGNGVRTVPEFIRQHSLNNIAAGAAGENWILGSMR